MDDMNLDLESDMKAAKILGRHVVRDGSGVYPESEPGSGTRATNIPFTLSDPATRDAVVQVLGEKYGISIRPHYDEYLGYFRAWMFGINEYDTYEEALRHAVMEVKDE